MKKLILLITIITLSYSCSGDSNNSNNNNNNSFTNSMDYEFTITINGEVHKIKGNTTNGIPYGQTSSGIFWINNSCYADNSQLNLVINDVTSSNYISGQNLQCLITFPNLLIGTNQAGVFFTGGYFQTLATSLGASSSLPAFSYFQTTSGSLNPSIYGKLPINITDLGTTSNNSTAGNTNTPYNFGQTLKGNYSGIIYLPNSTNNQCTIPVQLSIDFKALRRY